MAGERNVQTHDYPGGSLRRSVSESRIFCARSRRRRRARACRNRQCACEGREGHDRFVRNVRDAQKGRADRPQPKDGRAGDDHAEKGPALPAVASPQGAYPARPRREGAAFAPLQRLSSPPAPEGGSVTGGSRDLRAARPSG